MFSTGHGGVLMVSKISWIDKTFLEFGGGDSVSVSEISNRKIAARKAIADCCSSKTKHLKSDFYSVISWRSLPKCGLLIDLHKLSRKCVYPASYNAAIITS